MPRANRHFLPGQLWHITHRCHEKSFLFKFARDRRAYRHWLFEAKKRFGLCVLNYVVMSNHVHLLVQDTGEGVIAQSMQLIAGRTGGRNTTSASSARAPSGRTATMPRQSSRTGTCSAAWSIST
jgi:REP element-mobilizing transposase RayT